MIDIDSKDEGLEKKNLMLTKVMMKKFQYVENKKA